MQNAFVVSIAEGVCRLFDDACRTVRFETAVDLQNIVDGQAVGVFADQKCRAVGART